MFNKAKTECKAKNGIEIGFEFEFETKENYFFVCLD